MILTRFSLPLPSPYLSFLSSPLPFTPLLSSPSSPLLSPLLFSSLTPPATNPNPPPD